MRESEGRKHKAKKDRVGADEGIKGATVQPLCTWPV